MERARGYEDGCVATINHAVVEESAEDGCSGGGDGELFGDDGFTHDVFKFRAGFGVVVNGELGKGGGGEREEGEEEEEE